MRRLFSSARLLVRIFGLPLGILIIFHFQLGIVVPLPPRRPFYQTPEVFLGKFPKPDFEWKYLLYLQLPGRPEKAKAVSGQIPVHNVKLINWPLSATRNWTEKKPEKGQPQASWRVFLVNC